MKRDRLNEIIALIERKLKEIRKKKKVKKKRKNKELKSKETKSKKNRQKEKNSPAKIPAPPFKAAGGSGFIHWQEQ